MQLGIPSKPTTPTSAAALASAGQSSSDDNSSEDEDGDQVDVDDPEPPGVQHDQPLGDGDTGDDVVNAGPTEDDEQESVLRASAVTYLSGVVIHYLQKKFKCVACAQYLCKDNTILERDDELFVHFKAFDAKIASDFGNLKVPSDQFRSVIDICLTVFERQINYIIYKHNVKKTMFDLCVAAVSDIFPNWFTQCPVHRRFCLERLIIIKLKYELKIRISSLPKVGKTANTDQECVQKQVRRKLFH